MKRLARNLRDSSIDAFVLALETINRPSVAYRMEAFCILYCNAWELLMKARLIEQGQRIFDRKRRNQARRSISLENCLGRLFTDVNDPVRLNIGAVTELRNNAIHLVVPFVPVGVMGLFQAAVLNYSATLQEWFKVGLSDRVPLGMLSLVFEFDPSRHSLDAAQAHRRVPAESVRYLKEFQSNIQATANSLGEQSTKFYIPIDLNLALVKNPGKADITLSSGAAAQNALMVEVPKDPDKTHPNRRKEVKQALIDALGVEWGNYHDLDCVRIVYKIANQPRFSYKSKFASPQYSQAYIDWLIRSYRRNTNFFKSARQRRKNPL